MNSSWIDGPRHILFQLRCLKLVNKEVVNSVLPTVKRSAWFAFSECILQSLVCSSDQEERIDGIKKIFNIRAANYNLGSTKVRERKTPLINENAEKLVQLIKWDSGVYEPVLTTALNNSELEDLVNNPMQVPNWPCHSQAVERIVKQVIW